MSMDDKNLERVKISPIQFIFSIFLGGFLAFAGFAHLIWLRQEFLAQVPDWLPLDGDLVVVISGMIEIILGVGLIVLRGKYRVFIGWATAIFFILIFPGNISQYVNGIDAFGLTSDGARFIRLFFQPIFVIWALWSTGAWRALRAKYSSRSTSG